jgi:hypothetical protein
MFRYTGKIFNDAIYDMTLKAKDFPFLESSLHTLGLLNQNPVTEVMAAPVITLCEVESVRRVYEVLKYTQHNGFPTIDRFGRYRGLILRKTLNVLLELKAFSSKVSAGDSLKRPTFTEERDGPSDVGATPGGSRLTSAALVFYETLESRYPKYPSIDDVILSSDEMVMLMSPPPLSLPPTPLTPLLTGMVIEYVSGPESLHGHLCFHDSRERLCC